MIAVLLMAAAIEQGAPHTPVVVQPDYRLKPDARDILQFYPKAAAQKALPGQATIDCAVDIKGSLTDCTVFAEDPNGVGFGDGALKASSLFKLRPMTVDGVPTGGAKVRITIQFHGASPPTAPLSGLPPLPTGSLDPAQVRWLIKPSSQDFANYYPRVAFTRAVEGAAVIECVVNAELRLADCAVIAELPPGYAFGEAALKLGKLFKLPAPADGGELPVGRPIRIPIRFGLPH